MKRVARKALVILLKVCVLSAILAYAFSQMQIDDQLALPPGDSPAAAQLSGHPGADGKTVYVLTAEDGTPISIPENQRLSITGRGPRPSTTAAQADYLVAAPDGRHVLIPAAQVTGDAAVFRVLPGLRTTVRQVRWGPMLAGLVGMSIPMLLIGLRWLVLLRAADVHVPLATGLRLHYLGLFFNTFMPGGTGGDVIKAVAMARHTEHKAEAVSMILVDRVVGLLVILLLPAAMLMFHLEQAPVVGRAVGLGLVVVLGGAVLFFSRPFRRLIRWEALLCRLPGAGTLQRVDAAVFSLRHRKRALLLAVGLSVALQLISIFSIYLAGWALGIDRASFWHYLVFVPTGFLANSLPISFGGVGLMEGAFLKLFSSAGVATPEQAFMLGVAARLLMLAWALPGGIVAITGTGRVAVREGHAAESQPQAAAER